MKHFTRLFLSLCLCITAALANAQTVMVSAAASLTDAFTEIGLAFEQKNTQAKVEFNFAAAGALLQQITQGAPVDVFVSADQDIMDRAEKQNAIQAETRVNFTSNTLVLITPKDSSLKITSLEDLMAPEVKLTVLGNPNTTPIGRYIRDELTQKGLWTAFENKMVLAETVRQSLNYVSRAEVDAGFVFATDAKTAQDKTKIAFAVAPEQNLFVYPIAVTARSKQALAHEFVAFVLSAEGQAILEKYGFTSPRQ